MTHLTPSIARQLMDERVRAAQDHRRQATAGRIPGRRSQTRTVRPNGPPESRSGS